MTQFEIVATRERLSEAYLLPVLEALLDSFPFGILGFHADNGSEYINRTVAKLLDKLRVEFTKSRPRHSNDNGLAETTALSSANTSATALSHSPSEVNAFCQEFLNPYVNFHRPCFFALSFTDDKGKIRKQYTLANMMTPYEKLKSLPDAKNVLKPAVSFTQLDTNRQHVQR